MEDSQLVISFPIHKTRQTRITNKLIALQCGWRIVNSKIKDIKIVIKRSRSEKL